MVLLELIEYIRGLNKKKLEKRFNAEQVKHIEFDVAMSVIKS